MKIVCAWCQGTDGRFGYFPRHLRGLHGGRFGRIVFTSGAKETRMLRSKWG